MKRLIAVLFASLILYGCAEKDAYGPRTIGSLKYRGDRDFIGKIEQPLKKPTHWEMGEWADENPRSIGERQFFAGDFAN